ncbi:Lipoprotein-releasing system ATP-binding protein LolD [Planctomycetales bacterium 10988]|nr:Lipoprotein-releasing system ATP-binding protein LolD [Planctomycetales bacterium 10988]
MARADQTSPVGKANRSSSPTTEGLHGPHFVTGPQGAEETKNAPQSQLQTPPQRDVQLRTENLCKNYSKGKHVVPVLRGVNLEVQRGEFLAIIGQSGSGKSTLLHLLGTLDAPTEGAIYLDDERIDHLSSGSRNRLRNQSFGMVFQFYHLLPELTTIENVLMPLMIGNNVGDFFFHRRKYQQRATDLLETVGLGHRLHHRPKELSGGEMQRAAIARALAGNPRILLADEPTGNLDQETGREIMRLLVNLNKQENLTIIMVTHDLSVANSADRVVRLVSGQLELA